jgi:hypothetical protein
MCQPGLDEQREQQRRDQHRLDEQDRTEASAAACSANPAPGDEAAQPPLPIAQQPGEQAEMTDRFVGDLVRRPLVHDVAGGDEKAAPNASRAAMSAFSNADLQLVDETPRVLKIALLGRA